MGHSEQRHFILAHVEFTLRKEINFTELNLHSNNFVAKLYLFALTNSCTTKPHNQKCFISNSLFHLNKQEFLIRMNELSSAKLTSTRSKSGW